MLKTVGALVAAAFFLVSGCASTVISSMDEGTRIPVHLRLPDGNGPFPAVVLLHGCDGRMGSRHSWAGLERHANFLNDIGIAALLVDSFAYRDTTVSYSCNNNEDYYLARVLDAFAALRHLQSDERIIDDAIGVQGASQGAAVAIRTVSSNWMYAQYAPDPGFAAAIAFYPYCDVNSPLPPPTVPLLILSGSLDDWTPAGMCREWVQYHADHTPRPRLVVLDGAHHSFDLPGVEFQTFQGHTVASNPRAYRIAREHQRKFFLEHLVDQ